MSLYLFTVCLEFIILWSATYLPSINLLYALQNLVSGLSFFLWFISSSRACNLKIYLMLLSKRNKIDVFKVPFYSDFPMLFLIFSKPKFKNIYILGCMYYRVCDQKVNGVLSNTSVILKNL